MDQGPTPSEGFAALFSRVRRVVIIRQQAQLSESLARLHQSVASYRAGLIGSDALVSVTLDEVACAVRNLLDVNETEGEGPERARVESSLAALVQLFEESHQAANEEPEQLPTNFMPGYEIFLARLVKSAQALADRQDDAQKPLGQVDANQAANQNEPAAELERAQPSQGEPNGHQLRA